MTEVTCSETTPQDLRAAAHAVILDGEDVGSAAARKAGGAWSRALIAAYLANRRELLTLAGAYPPDPRAELRLLDLCRQGWGVGRSDACQLLIDRAMSGPEAPTGLHGSSVIRGVVTHYPPRTALVEDIFLRLPRAAVGDLEHQLAATAKVEISNGVVYEIDQFSGTTCILFADQEAIFGRSVKEDMW